ncbi:conserved hypothetical protein YbeL [hydrothermal vent metagenome]|uniref:Uncharacterized protein n=1 Tax=hydrothermal vent metagenome TaxID=652676 RepID=A0A3B1BSX0_9ZZZZ
MKKSSAHDPLDILGEVYEKMFESVVENFHKAEEKTDTLLHRLIDEAKDKAVELEEVSKEEAEKLAEYLKRDLTDALHYLSETGHELKDWLGFETALYENAILDLLLNAADKTTFELLTMKENLQQASVYRTGEITGPGTLICDQCGEKLHFHKAGKIPPCPKCHATTFHR